MADATGAFPFDGDSSSSSGWNTPDGTPTDQRDGGAQGSGAGDVVDVVLAGVGYDRSTTSVPLSSLLAPAFAGDAAAQTAVKTGDVGRLLRPRAAVLQPALSVRGPLRDAIIKKAPPSRPLSLRLNRAAPSLPPSRPNPKAKATSFSSASSASGSSRGACRESATQTPADENDGVDVRSAAGRLSAETGSGGDEENDRTAATRSSTTPGWFTDCLQQVVRQAVAEAIAPAVDATLVAATTAAALPSTAASRPSTSAAAATTGDDVRQESVLLPSSTSSGHEQQRVDGVHDLQRRPSATMDGLTATRDASAAAGGLSTTVDTRFSPFSAAAGLPGPLAAAARRAATQDPNAADPFMPPASPPIPVGTPSFSSLSSPASSVRDAPASALPGVAAERRDGEQQQPQEQQQQQQPALMRWSLSDLQRYVKQAVEENTKKEGEDDDVDDGMGYVQFDPDAEIDADWAVELQARRGRVGDFVKGTGAASTDDDDDDDDDGASVERTGRNANVAMTASGGTPNPTGRWCIPSHIPKLSASIPDLDWWFLQMREHIDGCRVTRQDEWIDLYRVHSETTFWRSVRRRILKEKLDPAKIMLHPHKFQEYVCLRYTPKIYPDKVMRRLFALKNKKLPTKEAWKETTKLVFCYNEFMRRRKGTKISELQHSYHFVYSLKDELFQYLNTLLDQQHPRVATAEMTFIAATEYEASLEERAGVGDPQGPEQVMVASGHKAQRSEGRRRDQQQQAGKKRKATKNGRERRGTVALAGTTATHASPSPPAVVSIATPPPPSTPPVQVVPATTGGQAYAVVAQQSTPTPPQTTQTLPRCYRCGEVGHFAAQCPYRFEKARRSASQRSQHRSQQQQGSNASKEGVCILWKGRT